MEQLDIQMQKKRESICVTKINSNWITDVNVIYKTIKLLEDNKKKQVDKCEFGDDFRNVTPKA